MIRCVFSSSQNYTFTIGAGTEQNGRLYYIKGTKCEDCISVIILAGRVVVKTKTR